MIALRRCPPALRGLGVLFSSTLTLATVAAEPQTLQPVGEAVPGSVMLLAAWVGSTRLIDNLVLP